jgi:hypothetical protein
MKGRNLYGGEHLSGANAGRQQKRSARASTQKMALFESPPRVLDQEYCLARVQFGTVKLFNRDRLKS